mgnify:CR=1 FL=1
MKTSVFGVTTMGVQRKKLPVQELEVGLFVADLDRPWHETPFPIQGFYIRHQREIDDLTRFCRHVFVDVAESRSRRSPLAAAGARQAVHGKTTADQKVIKLPAVRIRNAHHYETTRSLKRELKDAEPLLSGVEQALERVHNSIRNGSGAPDVRAVESVARSMAESVARNPDALLWLSRVQNRDHYVYRYSLNLSIWALLLGRQLGLEPDMLHRLSMGALLSQIGRLRLSQGLQQVPESSLNSEQWQAYCQYPELGAVLAEQSRLPGGVADVIRHHRERHNGSGFPAGLVGDKVPLMARLVGLVDCYETLVEPRESQHQVTPAEAVSRLYECRNTLFQEDLVEQFIQAVGVYPTGTIVELSSRELGVVVSHVPRRRLWPNVLVLTDCEHQPLKNGYTLSLARQNEKGGSGVRIIECKPLGYQGIDPSRYEVTGASSRWSWRHLVG